MAGQEERERLLEGVFGETVSVKVGESATLPGPKEIKTDDVIDWRFGDEKILIARVRKPNNPTTYDDALDGVFKGRLTLDGKTGDLTIRNTKTTDVGIYEVSNSINTFRNRVTLNVVPSPGDSGLSPGAIAGIVIAVVAVLAAAVVGIYYGYWKNKQML